MRALLPLLLTLGVLGFGGLGHGDETSLRPGDTPEAAAERGRLIDAHVRPRVRDPRVLEALRGVPRHLFVPPGLRSRAHENRPLPIGHGQTISQPLVVALMTELLELEPTSKVLEVGTGSGYQAAILAEMGAEVYSIEILPEVAALGAKNLEAAGYGRVHLRVGDGYDGWPEAAPFDGIIVTCAPDEIPKPLERQLAEGGRLVIPVGAPDDQTLVLVVKQDGKLRRRDVIPVAFVPMTGPGVDRPRAQPDR